MKKKFMVCLVASIALLVIGCGQIGTSSITTETEDKSVDKTVDKSSGEYFIGAYYGGASYGDYYDCLSGYFIICKDGTVEVYMPELESDGRKVKEYVYVKKLKLTDEQYNTIETKIDLDKLYNLDPMPDENVCDGYSKKLIIYDEDNQELKSCGGYMPRNEEFNEMYSVVFDNTPIDEMNEIRDEWIEELRETS